MTEEELHAMEERVLLKVDGLSKRANGLERSLVECKMRSHTWKLRAMRARVQVERLRLALQQVIGASSINRARKLAEAGLKTDVDYENSDNTAKE